jgi:transcriptional regulator with XRE-family HTH domain
MRLKSSTVTIPSMRDVAARAGVSSTTVSLVLRNHSAISDKTRQRVLQAQRDLGYKLNRPAQELMRSRRPIDRRKLDSLVFLLICARFEGHRLPAGLYGCEARFGLHAAGSYQ